MKPRKAKKQAGVSVVSSTDGGGSSPEKTSSAAAAIKQPVQDKAIAYIISGNIESFAKMLEEGSTELKFLNRYHSKSGKNALMVAAEEGRHEFAELLLEAKANINAVDKNGMTAFLYAMRHGQIRVAEMLNFAGADLSIDTEPAKQSAMLLAAKYNHMPCVNFLLLNELPVDLKDNKEETALTNAVKFEHYPIAQLLIDKGADINILGVNGNTMLLRSAFDKKEETAEFLLRNGANPDIKNDNGETALMIAARHGNIEIASHLLTAKADINATDVSLRTALILATMMNKLDSMRLLFEHGADVNSQDIWGYTALHHACVNTDGLEAMKLLLSRGAHLNTMDKCYNTPLMRAAVKNNTGLIFPLLEAGADFTLKNIDDKTAFDLMTDDALKERFIEEFMDTTEQQGGIISREKLAKVKAQDRNGVREKSDWIKKVNGNEWPF